MTYFYTKQQLQSVFASWKVTEPLPKKGHAVTVMFPNEILNYATITRHTEKSTYGKPLYKVEMEKK